MKNIKILVAILFVLLGWSCAEIDNLDPEGQWDLSQPANEAPAENASMVLDETKPNELVTFSWQPAVSSAGYGVYYKVVIDSLGTDNTNSPIIVLGEGSGTKELTLSIKQSTLDEALSLAGYPANAVANLTWGVLANSVGKTSVSFTDISVKRFTTEIKPTQLYISGDATEAGADLSQAIKLKRLNDSDGKASFKYELYTSLTEGKTYKFYNKKTLPAHQYGGKDGILIKSGAPIVVPASGVYRISVDLESNSYSLLKIEKWNVKGSPIINGWDGDEPLEYQGGGIWKGSMQLVNTGGFLFRGEVEGAGYWDYLLKRVKGSENTVIMESQAAGQGLEFEDIPSEKIGTFIFTLDLSADKYTYTIEPDMSVPQDLETPEQLFLLANGVKVYEFVKNGDIFSTDIYLALQSSVEYTLNSKEDGSGDTYTLEGEIGASTTPDNSKVTGNCKVSILSKGINVSRDMAYQITVDFNSAKLNWSYYNIFLFHWDELNQKWDDRNEFLMSYEHPHTFTVSAALVQQYDMKFISPWDIELGSNDAAALTGNLANKQGVNMRNITNSGTYTVTINLADDFETGTYKFVK